MIAQTPPMGWNSWDCYGAAVTEKDSKSKCRLYGKASSNNMDGNTLL